MKRLFFGMLVAGAAALIFISPAGNLCAQASKSSPQAQDWAKFGRFESANSQALKVRAERGVKPLAVFMGDSIFELWWGNDEKFFKEHNFLGRGISGQTTSHMLVRFRKDVLELSPKYVVILAGTNDIALNNGKIRLENIFGNIVSMCELAKIHKIKVVLCSVLPCTRYKWRPEVTDCAQQIKELNGMLASYAKANRILFVDFHSAMANPEGGLSPEVAPDGVHPCLNGYKRMESLLLKAMKLQ